jgi:hypothetical protein
MRIFDQKEKERKRAKHTLLDFSDDNKQKINV